MAGIENERQGGAIRGGLLPEQLEDEGEGEDDQEDMDGAGQYYEEEMGQEDYQFENDGSGDEMEE